MPLVEPRLYSDTTELADHSAMTTATTATTEKMSINGVLVVVSCRGQEYLSGAKNSFLDQKNKGKNFGETNRGTGTILMILI